MPDSLFLQIVKSWTVSAVPEYRGFRCAACQTYMSGGAYHHWQDGGGFLVPVHFCTACEEMFNVGTLVAPKHETVIDHRSFGLNYAPELRSHFDALAASWNTKSNPIIKSFTCDECGQPLSDAKGWHVWYNQNGKLIELHFDDACAIKLKIPTKDVA